MARFRPAQSEISIIASTRLLPSLACPQSERFDAMRSSDEVMVRCPIDISPSRHLALQSATGDLCCAFALLHFLLPREFMINRISPAHATARRQSPEVVTHAPPASADAFHPQHKCTVPDREPPPPPCRQRDPPASSTACREAFPLLVRVTHPAARGTAVRSSSPSLLCLPKPADRIPTHHPRQRGCVVSFAAPMQPNP